MKYINLIGVVTLAILNYSPASARASDIRPISEAHVEAASPGVVRIVCRQAGSDVLQVSRGGIIQTADTRRGEVILTTSHGLRDVSGTALEECWLYAPGGHRVDITSLTMPDRITEPGDDWAIIVTEEPFAPATVRLAPGRLSDLAQRDVPVAMLGPAARDRFCRLSHGVLNSDRIADLFTHDCRSRHGLSGTPLAVDTGDRLVIVALNIGRVLTLGSDIDSQGLALGLGGELGLTLEQAIGSVTNSRAGD
ncbi:hypothetical protein [Hyphobacterium marinum]|uniref:Serine protease n=1 Tax=Hyphobacterium marinum TaxID=3116574 RepID=A0ABU7LYQ7_9PROT|nr:hypothetical protein [Hyphobacterium sp. Y6023]MEE2566145.1 hypothetical protein [Hyphobacterium sp. Y6023]